MYRTIEDAALDQDVVATAYTARAMRDNRLWLDNARASVAAQLDGTTGHVHSAETDSFEYNFDDRIEIVTGQNDELAIQFQGTGVGLSTQTVALDGGIRTPTAHAAHVQAKLRAAFSGTTEISVVYDVTEDSETRGLFLIRHTGASGTRVLSLLFRSVAGSAAPAMRFRKADQYGALGYKGDGGFADSFPQDTIELSDGSWLDYNGFEDEAFTTDKFADEVVPGRAFQDDSIAAGKIKAGAVTGPKLGEAETGVIGTITNNNTGSVDVDIANGGVGRRPNWGVCSSTGASQGGLTVVSVTHVAGGAGNRWRVQVRNISGVTQNDVVVRGY